MNLLIIILSNEFFFCKIGEYEGTHVLWAELIKQKEEEYKEMSFMA